MRMLLANTQVRVSLISMSTLRSFHFIRPRFLLMLAMHCSLWTLGSRHMGTPRYFTWVKHGIPAIFGMGSSVRT